MTGFFSELTLTAHGFVRAASGAIVSFDAPGAGSGADRGTHPIAINSVAGIVGYFVDQPGTYDGFVRDPSGTFTTFDVADALGTWPSGINTAGYVIGTYEDAALVSHGFPRSPAGEIVTVGAIGGSCNVTAPVTGFNARVGFVRSPTGEFKAFSVPDSRETQVASISDTQRARGVFYMGQYQQYRSPRFSCLSIAKVALIPRRSRRHDLRRRRNRECCRGAMQVHAGT